PGIECRSGGGNRAHRVIVFFAEPVQITGASVTPGSGGTASIAGTPVVDHNQITVNLTNISDGQILMINLLGVSNGTAAADVHVPMGVLFGDVTANGKVTNTDVSAVQTNVDPTHQVTQGTCRSDVTVNGFVTNTDVSTVQTQVNPTGGLP